jgi:hypothetical protein
MAPRGRPAITEEVLQARIGEYCARYKVAPNENGLPPFPAGQRETRQHREWISLLKAGSRLRRRTAGLCRRCDAPAAPGKVFCGPHDPSSARTAPATSTSKCLVCGDAVAGTRVDEHRRKPDSDPVLVHRGCLDVIVSAQKAGPGLLDRVRDYLWPEDVPRRRRPRH